MIIEYYIANKYIEQADNDFMIKVGYGLPWVYESQEDIPVPSEYHDRVKAEHQKVSDFLASVNLDYSKETHDHDARNILYNLNQI